MPTFRQLREEAGLSVSQLSRAADVDWRTADNMDKGKPVQRLKALALVRALSEELGRTVRLEDITGLVVL